MSFTNDEKTKEVTKGVCHNGHVLKTISVAKNNFRGRECTYCCKNLSQKLATTCGICDCLACFDCKSLPWKYKHNYKIASELYNSIVIEKNSTKFLKKLAKLLMRLDDEYFSKLGNSIDNGASSQTQAKKDENNTKNANDTTGAATDMSVIFNEWTHEMKKQTVIMAAVETNNAEIVETLVANGVCGIFALLFFLLVAGCLSPGIPLFF